MRLHSTAAVAATGTAARLVAQASTKRCSVVTIHNNATSAGQAYIGADDTVTTATGLPIPEGQAISLEVDDPSTLWVIADTTADVRVGMLVDDGDRR